MACGLPAIVSDAVGCADDLVVSGETGEVFPKDSLAGLTSCLDRVASDAVYLQRLGDAARRRVARWAPSVAAEGTARAVREVARRPARGLRSQAQESPTEPWSRC
jgi:glycosyltransferase involved in cell wall biosynthesis